jgi:L-arabinose isomerase
MRMITVRIPAGGSMKYYRSVVTPALLRLGLFGIGLEAYWPQFPSLKERLEGYLGRVAEKLARPGVEVINAGLVDNPEQSFSVGRHFRRQDVDLIVLHVTTYALSSTVLPVVLRAKVPVLVLNLAPTPAIDYRAFNALGDRTKMTGDWLAHCSACPVPEIANVFKRSGVRFHQVTGVLDHDPECWGEIDAWIDAARVAAGMFGNRLGLMGHYYNGMLDIQSDLTLHCATFGTHIEHIEVEELAARRCDISATAVKARVQEFHEVFEIQPDCEADDLTEAARTAVALDRLVHDHRLGSLAYYYKGTSGSENEATIASIILGTSMLTARGVPVAGEYEVKNVQAMKIMDLFGAGGSFTEYYAMDFADDVVLMGHDGPGHIAIAQGRAKVRPLKVYHGKVGRGVSVEMAVRHGPVTLLSVIESGGKLALLCAEAESVPGPILEIGNTNSRYRFAGGAREFVNRWNSHGPAHHTAVGVGHLGEKISKLGLLLGLEAIRVC